MKDLIMMLDRKLFRVDYAIYMRERISLAAYVVKAYTYQSFAYYGKIWQQKWEIVYKCGRLKDKRGHNCGFEH